MASTTQTTNLELSQFVGTDKPAWLTDYNGDMQKIDSGYKRLEDANTATQADLDATKQDLSGSQTDIADVKASVQALEAQDIAIGNRLTVVEGNYDTMHHEVAINQQDINDIKTNIMPYKVQTNLANALINFAGNSTITGETIGGEGDYSIYTDINKSDGTGNRFGAAIDGASTKMFFGRFSSGALELMSQFIFPRNGFTADISQDSTTVSLIFFITTNTYIKIALNATNKKLSFIRNDGSGDSIIFEIQGA